MVGCGRLGDRLYTDWDKHWVFCVDCRKRKAGERGRDEIEKKKVRACVRVFEERDRSRKKARFWRDRQTETSEKFVVGTYLFV